MLEVICFREKKDGGFYPVRLGYARKNDKGALELYLDAIPAPEKYGKWKLIVQKQQDRQQRTEQPAPQPAQPPQYDEDLNDSVPF